MTDALPFGRQLQQHRQALGLTQKELAHSAGYAAVTVRKVEAGELRPSVTLTRRLAEALHLSPAEQAQLVALAFPVATPDLDATVDSTGTPLPVTPPAALPVMLPPAPPAHNLPVPATPLIGRAHELADLAALLADPDTRLVTILSAGGMGKTHLSIAAALEQVERFADGVCWVALAPLTDPDDLPLAIAAALGMQFAGERPPTQQLGDYLRSRQLLLVLDNFEHLLPTAALVVGELLAAAPQLKVLVSSRQRLKLSSEAVYFLDSLDLPDEDDADPLTSPALQLFLLHARRAQPGYTPDAGDVAAMATVCRLVQGMPLGILLAAAWSGVMGPPEIAAALRSDLGADLGLLHGELPDIPARQRNLHTLFLHTWARLSPAEQAVFMRLAVFRGGMTPTAAMQAAGATPDVLAGLNDKALLWRRNGGGSERNGKGAGHKARYEVHELLRQFAEGQLAGRDTVEPGVRHAAEAAHSRYYLTLLAEQHVLLAGDTLRAALYTIRADLENITAAWRWACREQTVDLLEPALDALFLFCEIHADYRTGDLLFGEAHAMLGAGDGQPTALGMRMLGHQGACQIMLGNYGDGVRLVEAALVQAGDEHDHAWMLVYDSIAAGEQGDLPRMWAQLEASLAIFQQLQDDAGIALALHHRQYCETDYAKAYVLAAESLSFARRAERLNLVTATLSYLGWQALCLGLYDQALAHFNEALALATEFGFREEQAWTLDCLGYMAWGRGDMVAAERDLRAAMAGYTAVGRQAHIGMSMAELSLVLTDTNRVAQAVPLVRQAVALTREANSQLMLVTSLLYESWAYMVAGDLASARPSVSEGLARAWQHQYLFMVMSAFYFFAQSLDRESDQRTEADAIAQRSLAVALLAHVRGSTATWQIFRDKAAVLQGQIEPKLPAGVVAAARRAGHRRSAADLVAELLGNQAPVNAPDRVPAPLLPSPGHAAPPLVEPLTEREQQVLHLLADGASNQDIAGHLVITHGTAKWYVSQILAKLGVHSRTQALAQAHRLGLL